MACEPEHVKCNFSPESLVVLQGLAQDLQRGEVFKIPKWMPGVLKWILGILVSLLIIMGGALITLMVDVHGKASIEDVSALKSKMDASDANLLLKMVTLERTLPNTFPPDWFKEKFDRLEKKVDEMDKKVDVNGAKLDALTSKS